MNEDFYRKMDEEAYRIAYLIAGYIRNTLTEREHIELDDWVNENDNNMKLFEDLTDERNVSANLEWMDKIQSEKIFKQLRHEGRFEKPKRIIRRWAWMPAAAVFVLVLFFAHRYYKQAADANDKPLVNSPEPLQPGGNKATLTLPGGVVIDLNAAKEGALLEENARVSKPADGELLYGGDASAGAGRGVHVLSTPVGGQYQVTLRDGTKVWLNAESTLRYPAAFSEKERKVELSGEAYFEVARNAEMPFKVTLADSNTVSVLGTHFNVQAYPGEKEKTITLVEGKVLVASKEKQVILTPAMQAAINETKVSTASNVDVEDVTGWKDGLFVFHDAPIEKIMNQVARWYNAKVIYQGSIKQQFNATIHRSEPLSKLLHLLELNGYVKFKTENNIIYVSP
jgi:ferric-dicitrate binding protein FerR (iron transport regulator)